METIGDKIKRIRKSKGLSLMDLAKILSVSKTEKVSDTALSKIETGSTKSVTVALGKRLAKALDISFVELFDIESLNPSDKETDRLKILAFHSLDKYESNQIFLKQFEHNQEDPEDWKKFEEFKLYLSEFKKGIFEKLIEVNFCTQEDIKEYRNYVYRQANERMFVKKDEVKSEEDPDVKKLVEEIALKEMDHFGKQLFDGTKLEDITTIDGRPYNKNIKVSGDSTIANFTHPDHELLLNINNELDQIIPDIYDGKPQNKELVKSNLKETAKKQE